MNETFFLDWAGLAVSLFNTISLAWLALTVLFNGNRRSAGTWITGVGLLLGAILFVSHTAILGRGLSNVGLGMDFWWWVSWGPAVIAPPAWYGAMLWYTGFPWGKRHPHRFWLALVPAWAVVVILLLLLANPLPSYGHVVVRNLEPAPMTVGVPALLLAYLGYMLLCYLLPLDLLRRAEVEASPLAAAARHRARPWLTAVSALFLAAGVVAAWTALWALQVSPPTLSDPGVATAAKRFDLAVIGLIGLGITLLGRAIVAHAVFTERPLPRRGFFRQWRSTVILAAGLGTVVAWGLTIQLRPLYMLMLVIGIMTVFHALYSWRASVEREQFMAQLRPFIASQGLYDQIVDAAPLDRGTVQHLFESLCHDVLGVRAAVLVPCGTLATLAGPPLVYAPSGTTIAVPAVAELAEWFPSPEVPYRPAGATGATWAVALWDKRRLGGVLLLAEKANGSPYSEEEIEIARAGGERLLDTLAGAEMAGLAMRLLRQHIAQVQVMERQGRRVLHDQVLPQLHTAILYLSGRREEPAVQEAIDTLTAAHRQISDLIHAVPMVTPQRLVEEGPVAALRETVEGEFAGDFDAVHWEVLPGAEEAARRLPLFVAEVVLFAARELVRNAARHGRGGATDRPLHLTVRWEVDQALRFIVEDDGVGLNGAGRANVEDGGSGLPFHSTMVAAVGGRLEVSTLPRGGTRGVILLPTEIGMGAWHQHGL